MDESKCYQSGVTNAYGETAGLLATTIKFGRNDFCAFKIAPTDSDFYFMRYMNVTIERNVDSDCKIYYGNQIKDLESPWLGVTDCTNSNLTSYQFFSYEYIVIVVQG